MSKEYDILLTEDQRREIASRHDETVTEKVVNKLKTKKKELEWVESKDQLSKRFQTAFGKDGVDFLETGFEAHNREWRAVLILSRKCDTMVFHRAVKKQDNYTTSRQKDIIANLQANPKAAEEKVLDILLDYQSGKTENLLN